METNYHPLKQFKRRAGDFTSPFRVREGGQFSMFFCVALDAAQNLSVFSDKDKTYGVINSLSVQLVGKKNEKDGKGSWVCVCLYKKKYKRRMIHAALQRACV